ncbi:MAG TPA: BglII/BstYI family type II restriction endonuclease [Candidatus Limnocylindria bacterium]|jgi:hypothetical protein|nr:BglII/BstYI family type II restriction endonuclease [Candidatus Limnocylindria bacterium]
MDFIPADLKALYEVYEWRNASVILGAKHEEEWADILAALRAFKLKESYITNPGGGRSEVPIFIDGQLAAKGWKKKRFETKITVDEATYNSPTHEVDMFKNRVAVEVEWNNKTEFYDRDLNNFRLLFDLRVVDVGVIITRSDELRTGGGIWVKYGPSSTNVGKLIPRLEGGGGGGCPVLVFGITKKLFVKGE